MSRELYAKVIAKTEPHIDTVCCYDIDVAASPRATHVATCRWEDRAAYVRIDGPEGAVYLSAASLSVILDWVDDEREKRGIQRWSEKK